MQRNTKKDYVSPIEFVKETRFSLDRVYVWIYEGKLPAEKVNGRWRISRETTDAFIAKQAEKNEEE